MMITDEQIQLVQSSFVKISVDAVTFSSNFYDALFALAPEVRPMFKEDMLEQGDKLIKMLGIIINHLYDLDIINHQIVSLAKRHVSYGVKKQHYNVVGQALLTAIKMQLGNTSSQAILDAWQAIFDNLASQMRLATEQT